MAVSFLKHRLQVYVYWSQVISVIERRPELRKISFVAHSLGGLIARYAIGRLYGMKPASQPCDGKACCERGDHEAENCENMKGKIVGLEAMNFITFATPHAGSGGHRQVIFLFLVLLDMTFSYLPLADIRYQMLTWHFYNCMCKMFKICICCLSWCTDSYVLWFPSFRTNSSSKLMYH